MTEEDGKHSVKEKQKEKEKSKEKEKDSERLVKEPSKKNARPKIDQNAINAVYGNAENSENRGTALLENLGKMITGSKISIIKHQMSGFLNSKENNKTPTTTQSNQSTAEPRINQHIKTHLSYNLNDLDLIQEDSKQFKYDDFQIDHSFLDQLSYEDLLQSEAIQGIPNIHCLDFLKSKRLSSSNNNLELDRKDSPQSYSDFWNDYSRDRPK